jgi:hypothetical protein
MDIEVRAEIRLTSIPFSAQPLLPMNNLRGGCKRNELLERLQADSGAVFAKNVLRRGIALMRYVVQYGKLSVSFLNSNLKLMIYDVLAEGNFYSYAKQFHSHTR